MFAYIRVSSKEQNTGRQIEAVKAFSPALTRKNIYIDKQSGKDFNREAYQDMKSLLEPGDEVIIKELDRLGRNKEGVKDEIKWFRDNRITLRILNLPTSLIDFQGQDWIIEMLNNILVEVLAAFAEEERVKIKMRQAEGIALAKANGVRWGPEPTRPPQFQEYLARVERKEITAKKAYTELGISKSLWYKIRASGDF